jgi:hypothetical protein
MSNNTVNMSDNAVNMSDNAVNMSDNAVNMSDNAHVMSDNALVMSDNALVMSEDEDPTVNAFEDVRNDNLKKINNMLNKCNNNKGALKIFSKLLDNNIDTLQEIESKQKTNFKYSGSKNTTVNELNHIIKTLKEQKDLNLEKDTLLLITEERNKNIELYYIIYILFIVLLLIIQGSIVIFK